jgi:hypothetical protein
VCVGGGSLAGGGGFGGWGVGGGVSTMAVSSGNNGLTGKSATPQAILNQGHWQQCATGQAAGQDKTGARQRNAAAAATAVVLLCTCSVVAGLLCCVCSCLMTWTPSCRGLDSSSTVSAVPVLSRT